MPITSLADYKTFAGITSTDATRDAALTVMVAECIDAVVRYCKNGSLESASYTVYLDAPTRNVLYLPHFPVAASGLQIWLNTEANGDPTLFTSADLLTAYTDYVLDTGPDDASYSYTGKVTLVSGGPWSSTNYVRPVYSLATRLEPARKAIKATYTAGWASVPASLSGAVNLLVSKLYAMRKLGMPTTSESLNGYSASWQSTATANGILQGDPTIRQQLKPFTRGIFVGQYGGAG